MDIVRLLVHVLALRDGKANTVTCQFASVIALVMANAFTRGCANVRMGGQGIIAPSLPKNQPCTACICAQTMANVFKACASARRAGAVATAASVCVTLTAGVTVFVKRMGCADALVDGRAQLAVIPTAQPTAATTGFASFLEFAIAQILIMVQHVISFAVCLVWMLSVMAKENAKTGHAFVKGPGVEKHVQSRAVLETAMARGPARFPECASVMLAGTVHCVSTSIAPTTVMDTGDAIISMRLVIALLVTLGKAVQLLPAQLNAPTQVGFAMFQMFAPARSKSRV